MASWHIDIFDKYPDPRNLMIYARLFKKMKNINIFKRRKQNLLLCKTGGRVVH